MTPGQNPKTPHPATPPVTGDSEQVDQICDRFEAAWLAGEQPRLEAYLQEIAVSLRPRLLSELLTAQWDLFRQEGREVEIGSYLARFAEEGELVRQAYDKWVAEPSKTTDTEPCDTVAAHEDPAGRLLPEIPGYEIHQILGRGGMGVVYAARHVRLDRPVALKMILAGRYAGRADIDRFYAEARAAASLNHPGIVPIYEFGEHAGHHYIAMGLVEGPTLASYLKEHGPLPVDRAAELVETIARAVHVAHQHGIIHRDLKPANILLDRHGEPQIADFGLAKRRDISSNMTVTGEILGTPAYMAPEQAAGRTRHVDERSDVYAIGGILYTALTARPPFVAETTMDILLHVLENEPASPRNMNPSVPRDLNSICLRCLEKRAADRYRSAGELADELSHFRQGEPLEVHSAQLVRRFRRWLRREPVLAAHLIAIGVIFALLHWTWVMIGTGFALHVSNLSVLLTWAIISLILQRLYHVDRCVRWVPPVWAVADAVLLTCLLAWADAPIGPLLVGYPLLIAFFGLFSRIRLVALMTAVATLSFVTLLLLRADLQYSAYHILVFAGSLSLLGFIVGFQVQRLRVIGRHLGKCG